MSALKILHLEDNQRDADLVEATLAAGGLAADLVRVDRREAFEAALESGDFDVILADYTLPSFDGVSAQVLAARSHPDVPFIFLSGSIGEDLAVERLKAGATDYVLKDRMARLPAAVARALAEAAERAERRRAEEQVRRLNADLEQRVIDRTAELARTNDALAARERELRDAKSFLEDLVAASPSMIFRLDPATRRVTYASPNIGWLLGYDVLEIVGVAGGWEQMLHPADRPRVVDRISAAVDEGTVQIEEEYRLRRKDGRYRWFFSLMRVDYDAAGHPETMLLYCLDIADRKVAEEARAESERRLQAILDHSPAAISLKDMSGRYVLVNREFERIAGRTRDAIAGKTDSDLFAPRLAEMYCAHDDQVRATNRALEIEETFLQPPDVRVHHSIKFPLLDADGDPYALCAISIDITERKKTDDALRVARLEAERANRAKSEFLSRMSHELRTPLNAILGFAQLLDVEEFGEETQESARQILHGGEHLLALINEVLDIARIEAGHLSLALETVDARETVQLAMDLVRPLAHPRGVSLAIDDSGATDVSVLADRQRLNQILLNLLSNAVKYNQPGGRVTVGFDQIEPDRIRISVSDTGRGMSPDQLQRLFQPFERLGADQTSVEGTGLGLAVSRGLAEAMSGSLGVESRVGHGSTFWMELKRSAAHKSTHAPAPASAPRAAKIVTETAGAVLYIEDNASNVRLMERVFQRRPAVRLIHAPSGADGLRLAHQERPDLIFLDRHLPDMSGEDVLRELRNDPSVRGTPVAILSADVTSADTGQLQAAGAIAYLTKPLEIGAVLQLLDQRLKHVPRQADHADAP